MKNFYKTLLISFIVVMSMLLTACPNSQDLEKVEKESGKIASATMKIENAIEEMLDQNILTAARAKSILTVSDKLITYGQASDEFLRILKEKYGNLKNVDKAEIPAAINIFIDMVKAFAVVLGELKLIPMLNQKILDGIEIIKLTVNLAAKIFNRQKEVETIIGPPLKALGV